VGVGVGVLVGVGVGVGAFVGVGDGVFVGVGVASAGSTTNVSGIGRYRLSPLQSSFRYTVAVTM
jgi:hypothetical protein